MRVTRKSRPILKDHDRGSIVGHTDDITINDKSLVVAGVISGVGTTAQEVIATSENGFPWQASLGASADKVVFIPEGKTAKANGRDHKGPVYIARKSTLGEVSFVALGADDNTEARVAAGNYADVEDPGDEPEDTEPETTDDLEPVNASLNMSTKPKTETKATIRRSTKCVPRPRPNPVASPAFASCVRRNHPDIEADAIEQGWSITKTELAVLRSERPKAPDQTQHSPRHDRVKSSKPPRVSRSASKKRFCWPATARRRSTPPTRSATSVCENSSPSVPAAKASTCRVSSATERQRSAPVSVP